MRRVRGKAKEPNPDAPASKTVEESFREVEEKYEKVQSRAHPESIPVSELPDLPAPDLDLENLLPFTPTPEQMRFARAYISNEKFYTYRAVAKYCKIEYSLVKEWFMDYRFVVWLNTIRKHNFGMWKGLIDKVVIKKALAGSYKHAELIYRLTGELRETEESEIVAGAVSGKMPKELGEQFVLFQKRVRSLVGIMGQPQMPTDHKEAQKILDKPPASTSRLTEATFEDVGKAKDAEEEDAD